MNLSKQGNMFTETLFDKNVGEIEKKSSVADLDFSIGKLSVSPGQPKSSFVRADKSTMSMVTPDASGSGLLLAFDSISFMEGASQRDNVAKETIKTHSYGSSVEVDLPGQTPNDVKYNNKVDSSDFAGLTEPSTDWDGEAEVVVESDQTCKSNHPLIVYTSSRKSTCDATLNQNKSRRPQRNSKRTANKNSLLELNSSQILRRRRSLSSARARISAWGLLGNILPASEEQSGLDLNSSNVKKPRRPRGGQGIRNAVGGQVVRKSIGKTCTPTGRISLKIKIGNQSCSLGNVTENFKAPESKLEKEVPIDTVLPHARNLENAMPSNASILSTNVDAKGIVEKPCFSTLRDHRQIISQEEDHNLEASTDNRSTDPGTSPDSEVINSVPDIPHVGKGLPNMQSSPMVPSALVSVGDVSCLNFLQKKSKKGKMKDNLHDTGKCSAESNSMVAEVANAEVSSDFGPEQKVGNISYGNDASIFTTAKPYLNIYSSKEVSRVPLCCSRMTESGITPDTSKVNAGTEMNPSSGLVESLYPQVCDELTPTNGKKFLKFSIANGGSKSRSGIFVVPGEKDKSSKKKRNQKKSGGMHKFNEKDNTGSVRNEMESNVVAGIQISADPGETGAPSKGATGPVNNLHFSDGEVRDQYVPVRNAWVLCDECQKWRRILATLADQIEETNCGWTCKENTDKDFADCSISQEKSNAEINEELEISDGSCEEDACDASLKSNPNCPMVSQQSSWSLVKSNLFLHRNRKTQTIDEVMVCHCKPPIDGRMGCGTKCLNRMLNIECVRGTCPCGELCSNQQFQRRKYAKLKWFRCGKKGHGLQALEDISEGQFLIEYVGEVLGVHAYEARQREYALNGHKHFYFMTLNGSEVIDACAKGNLGRFINHSCDPNCRTEKWMVNGEVCVGLFAVRDIKKGEEVTFDYNYVRVFGAAVKKCVCGSPNCRGYIGGDPLNSEVIVQGDSEDECSEPLMVCGDREMKDDWNDIMSNSLEAIEDEIVNEPPENIYRMNKLEFAAGHSDSIAETHTRETLTQKVEGVISVSPDRCLKTLADARTVKTIVRHKLKVDNFNGNDSAANAVRQLYVYGETRESVNRSMSAASEVKTEGILSEMHSSVKLMNNSSQSDGNMNTEFSSDQNQYSLVEKRVVNSLCSAHRPETIASALPSKSMLGTVKSKGKLKYTAVGGRKELVKSIPLAKTHHSSSSIKKGKVKSEVVTGKGTPDVDKSNAAPQKSENLQELSLNGHFEAVEEKLNELLDSEGGISKRKDASRGYLKLLFLTAASGNNGRGEAIQSNRDLSMILDALLKTKSRTVLVDIINKNGLQMLHNIMKRYRKEFIKTPILRKLLKVLEYLAAREILTLEHITGGPPCPGVESFKDSILTLTEHADKQVHQIARNFRDRWIPRSLRKNSCMERDDVRMEGRMEFPQRSNYSRFLLPQDHGSDRVGKSSEAIDSCEVQLEATTSAVDISTLNYLSASGGCGTNGTKTRKRKSRWDNPAEDHPRSRIRTDLEGDGKLNIDEDVPPGFSSPCHGPMLPSDASLAAINFQERDVGIKYPFDIVLGDSQQRYIASMSVSYGIPFSIMQQLGVHAETSEGWTIAPGVPFHPFPPLPTYARNNGDLQTPAPKCAPASEPERKAEHGSDKFVTHLSGQKHARTSDMDPQEMNVLGANGRLDFPQGGNSYNLGKKYFRQQKWNHSKSTPPWVRMRNGWWCAGNNTRNGV